MLIEAVFDESPPVLDQVVIALVVNDDGVALSDCDVRVLENVDLLDEALDIVDEEPELAEGVFVQVLGDLFEPILELQIQGVNEHLRIVPLILLNLLLLSVFKCRT